MNLVQIGVIRNHTSAKGLSALITELQFWY